MQQDLQELVQEGTMSVNKFLISMACLSLLGVDDLGQVVALDFTSSIILHSSAISIMLQLSRQGRDHT